MKKMPHGVGIMLLLATLLCSIANGGENGDDADNNDLRPTHIDVDGDQNVIEKAFAPGTQGTDHLSHARRSTVYVGGVQPMKRAPRTGYHRTSEVQFTSGASAFLYAYPTPESKAAMNKPVDDAEGPSSTFAFSIWIVTCAHVVESEKFIGVRLNTATEGSVTYITPVTSWERNQQADVAVLDFKGWRNPDIDLAMFEYRQAVEKEQIVSHALYEGTPVAMTGYPISRLQSPDRNFPVVQFGYIAQIQGYLATEKGHDVFLIGGAAFPGNSGGPVLIPGGTPTGVTRYFRRGLLIGMVCAQRLAPTVMDTGKSSPVRQSAHLAQVVPMAAIHNAIEGSVGWKSRLN